MRAMWILAGVLVGLPAAADQLDLSFNADAVRAEYARPLGGRGLQWDAGWLHHQDNGDVLHASLQLTGKATEGSYPVTGGLGLRLAYSDGDLRDQQGFAVAVGGFFRYAIPRYDRFAIGGHAYLAPGVLSLGDVEKFQDFGIRLSYNVLREADVYVGARYVRGDYDDAPDARYDTGMHAGIALRF